MIRLASPVDIEHFREQLDGKTVLTWHDGVLPSGKPCRIKQSLRGGVQFIQLRVPVKDSLVGRFREVSINTKTRVVKEK